MNFALTGILLSALQTFTKSPLTLVGAENTGAILDVADDFKGLRYNSILSVYVTISQTEKGTRYKSCYGTPINSNIVLVPCSCLLHVDPRAKKKEIPPPGNVAVLPMMMETRFRKKEIYDDVLNLKYMTFANAIELHPLCNRDLQVDLALLSMRNEIRHKPVWFHSVEKLIFKWNVHRVSAASVLSEGCKTYQLRRSGISPYSYWVWVRVPVTIRPWVECGPLSRYKKQVEGKYCVHWDMVRPLCSDIVGLPIFCDVEEVEGFIGMIMSHSLSNSYQCMAWYDQYAILQSVDAHVDWIRQFTTITLSPAYYANIPKYFFSQRYEVYHPNLIGSADESEKYAFDYYSGPKYQSIISVFSGKDDEELYKLQCLGTIIRFDMAMVPCSCIGVIPSGFKAYDWRHTNLPRKNLNPMDKKLLHSYRWIDAKGDHLGYDLKEHVYQTKELYLHPKCDNAFELNNGLLQVTQPFKSTKMAWIPTYDFLVLSKRMVLLEIADAVRGSCGYPYMGSNVNAPYPHMGRVRIMNWSVCINTVCLIDKDTVKSKDFDFNRCLNHVRGSRYCLQAINPSLRLCEATPGTPIFCNTHLARGLIGFISTSWNHCTGSQVNTAVMEPITEIIFQFSSIIKGETGIGIISH